jgi:hypothetical protein
LFRYLSQHADICPSRVKETRYFLPLSEGDGDSNGVLEPLERYAKLFERCGAEPYVMEATPHYFIGGGRLIEGLQGALSDPRIVITLRDPVERIWSVYRFAKGILQLPAGMTFEQYFTLCERVFEERAPRMRENRPYWSMRGGVYVDYLPDWLEAFANDRLLILFFEDLRADPVSVIGKVCRWLQIDDSHVPSFDYTVENQSAPYRSRALQRVALLANREGMLRNRPSLKKPLRRLYRSINRASDEPRMPPAIREQLENVFRYPNARLAGALLARGYLDLPPWLSDVSPPRGGAGEHTEER